MTLSRLLNIDDLRNLARQRLPGFAFDYLDGGAEAEQTLLHNRSIFSQWRFQPAALVDTSQCSAAAKLLGVPATAPVAVAPTGFNGMLWPDADILLARAARDAGVPFTLSTMASRSLEDVANEAKGVRLWFQLYVLKDRGIAKDLLKRALSVNCDTLIVTTDCAHYGKREREQRHFRAPLKLSLPAIIDVACHPRWLQRVVWPTRGLPGFGNLAPYLPTGEQGRGAQFIAKQLDPSLNWSALENMRQAWPGKLVIKGILNRADVQRAAAIGVDAVVLSNHGGRQLDSSISPMEILASVHKEFAGRIQILIDSGFRRGTDIIKALALGADGVLIGRPLLYGVAAAGQNGAQHALQILLNELRLGLAQLGAPDIASLRAGDFLRSHSQEFAPLSPP
ncbi:alpha-hydroxy acid oxidase [Uliginosibacterium gangwonense]|uniref:alpha-hydroxy acid oxidase n=1 Tax=Uliginosibacterium gangwonense TaxID=392736 RepID=UPI00037C1BC6|nr:alpha-hydroxy acid oxidase [Uliginosibacterium gangwonense]